MENYVESSVGKLICVAFPDAISCTCDNGPRWCAAVGMVVMVARYGRWSHVSVDKKRELKDLDRDPSDSNETENLGACIHCDYDCQISLIKVLQTIFQTVEEITINNLN